MPVEAMFEWGITLLVFALLIGIVGLIPGPLPLPKDEPERLPVATEQDQQQEFDEQIRAFLRELDACQSEEARIRCVAELIFGIIVAARKEKLHDGSQPTVRKN